MPTPGGRPKRGDRVEFRGEQGTVITRTHGEYYALLIQWDGEKNRPARMMVDAPYYLQKGELKII